MLENAWGSSFWASLPFSVLIAMFSLSSLIGGRQYIKKGIKRVSLLSMLFTSAGLLLSSLVEVIAHPLYLVITYGILAGIGNGLGYVPVVAMARKWFPDKTGLATGIVIFGYSGSAVVFAPLKAMLLNIHGLSVTFLIIGFLSLTLGLLGVSLIADPPPGLVESYLNNSRSKLVIPREDMPPARAIRTIDFWLLWASFFLVSGAGLMLIGHLISFAASRGLGLMEAATAVSAFSVMNALGRPPAEWISDRMGKYGRPITMAALFSLQSALFALLVFVGYTLWELYLLIAIAGFVYGSALALYPAFTGDFFGLKYLSANYAFIFTGWGLAGLVSPALGGYIKDISGGYNDALLILGAMSLAGAVICAVLKYRLEKYLS